MFGQMNEAMETFWEMKGTGIKPDIVIYRTVLSGYCRNGYFHIASEFSKEMVEKCTKA